MDQAAASIFCNYVVSGNIYYIRLVTVGDIITGMPYKSQNYVHPCSGSGHRRLVVRKCKREVPHLCTSQDETMISKLTTAASSGAGLLSEMMSGLKNYISNPNRAIMQLAQTFFAYVARPHLNYLGIVISDGRKSFNKFIEKAPTLSTSDQSQLMGEISSTVLDVEPTESLETQESASASASESVPVTESVLNAPLQPTGILCRIIVCQGLNTNISAAFFYLDQVTPVEGQGIIKEDLLITTKVFSIILGGLQDSAFTIPLKDEIGFEPNQRLVDLQKIIGENVPSPYIGCDIATNGAVQETSRFDQASRLASRGFSSASQLASIGTAYGSQLAKSMPGSISNFGSYFSSQKSPNTPISLQPEVVPGEVSVVKDQEQQPIQQEQKSYTHFGVTVPDIVRSSLSSGINRITSLGKGFLWGGKLKRRKQTKKLKFRNKNKNEKNEKNKKNEKNGKNLRKTKKTKRYRKSNKTVRHNKRRIHKKTRK
jgi:hypothetical protein